MSQISHCLVFKLPFDGLKVVHMRYLSNCPHNLGFFAVPGSVAGRIRDRRERRGQALSGGNTGAERRPVPDAP